MSARLLVRVVYIGSGIDTDSIAASDTQYRVSIGGRLLLKKGYRKGIEAVSIDTPKAILRLSLQSLVYNKK
jgi:hypothetical protein